MADGRPRGIATVISRHQRPRGVRRTGSLLIACTAIALAHLGCGSVGAAQAGTGASQATTAEDAGRRSILNGYRRYNASCNHCHGPDGVGSSFGPGLIETPLGAEAFRDAVLMGRSSGLSVMKGFAKDPNVEPYVADIYAYLRARAEGRVGRGRPRLTP